MQTGHVPAPHHGAPLPSRVPPTAPPATPTRADRASEPALVGAGSPEDRAPAIRRTPDEVHVDYHPGTGSYVTKVIEPDTGAVHQTPAPTLLALAELAIRRMRDGA